MPDIYASEVLLGSYKLGAGQFFVNSLPVLENIAAHPAADRLLINLIEDAAPSAHGKAAALPGDFDSQLQAMGYTG